jgi:hypothetical protein
MSSKRILSEDPVIQEIHLELANWVMKLSQTFTGKPIAPATSVDECEARIRDCEKRIVKHCEEFYPGLKTLNLSDD